MHQLSLLIDLLENKALFSIRWDLLAFLLLLLIIEFTGVSEGGTNEESLKLIRGGGWSDCWRIGMLSGGRVFEKDNHEVKDVIRGSKIINQASIFCYFYIHFHYYISQTIQLVSYKFLINSHLYIRKVSLDIVTNQLLSLLTFYFQCIVLTMFIFEIKPKFELWDWVIYVSYTTSTEKIVSNLLFVQLIITEGAYQYHKWLSFIQWYQLSFNGPEFRFCVISVSIFRHRWFRCYWIRTFSFDRTAIFLTFYLYLLCKCSLFILFIIISFLYIHWGFYDILFLYSAYKIIDHSRHVLRFNGILKSCWTLEALLSMHYSSLILQH